jgi:maleate cis-trans isomerase
MYGVKGKVGLLVPAGNRVILPEFYRIDPEGMAFFETRMIIEGSWISEDSNFAMIENAARGLNELKVCRVELCVLACTATSFLKGKGWDEAFTRKALEETGIPATTTVLSILEALAFLNVKKVAVATPWHSEINQKAVSYLQGNGYDVVRVYSEPLDRITVNDQWPDFAQRLAQKADHEAAEAVCLFATDLRTIDILSPAEKILGKPVISSNQSILFNVLRILGHNQTLPGYGSLLENSWQVAEKGIFGRLLKNAQMQGPRNPEE